MKKYMLQKWIKGNGFKYLSRNFNKNDCFYNPSAMKKTKISLYRYALALAIVFFSNLIKAQEEFVAPPAKFLSTVPFTILTGGIIILHGTVDGFPDSLNFVLDTGSGGISLDSSTSSYFHLKEVPSDRIVRGIAGAKTVSYTYNHTLHLEGMDVDRLDFHINDYDILTSAYGLKIDGLIGYSFLRRYIVAIDYDNQVLQVYTPGSYKYPHGGTLLKPQFTNLPMQSVHVKDNRDVYDRFYFDIGAGLCMLLSTDLVQDSSVFKRKRKFYPTQAEGFGGKKEMYISVVKEVKIGPYKFRDVPVYVFNDEFGVTNYPVLGGLLGNDIMRRFNITLNYPEQQIYIKPNKHYTDSFDYSYTGLGVYVVEGRIEVVDVIKKSPAEDAGFQPGDEIIGVENNFTGNIQAYKALFQNTKAKLKVVVRRNGELITLTLRVKSIL
jgi:hypothetical protein